MAREIKKPVLKKKPQLTTLPFIKTNFQIIGIGIFIIALGYIAMAQSPWDGTMPLVVAPILLLLGYCVVIPFGILYRRKQEPTALTPDQQQGV